MGYVACIIGDCIPEEELDFYINNENLHLRLLKRNLDSVTKEKLMHRLKKTNFFKKIDITVGYSSTSSEANNATYPLNSQVSKSSHEILPASTIYDSPIADPKWPRFSAGYSKHLKKTYGRSIFNLSFGENLPLLRCRTDGWSYELGLQAGVFGLMDNWVFSQ